MRFQLQFRGEFYILNYSNMCILANNLDIEGGLSSIEAVKGQPSQGASNGELPDERRNIQLALKLLF